MTNQLANVGDFQLQVGWNGSIAGKLHFSTVDAFFGSTDVFASTWTQYFTNPYSDVSADIAEGSTVRWSRGSDTQVNAQVQVGEMSFQLLHAANPALYDPNDPTSPLAGLILPMRPVWLTGTLDLHGTTPMLGCFGGFITEVSYDPNTFVSSFTCQDMLAWLNRLYPVIPSTSGLTTSGAIQLLLNAIGFTDPAYINLDPAPALTNITFSADGTQTAFALLGDLLSAERGTVWMDGNWGFHFEGRYARDARKAGSASYSFSSSLVGLDSKVTVDLIGNRAIVTSVSGNQQVATDPASIQNYGVIDAANVSSAYIDSDPHALDLAHLLVQRAKDAHPPLVASADNDSADSINAQLGVDINQRVAIAGVDCFVERLDQELAAGGMKLETQLTVTQAPAAQALLFGTTPVFGTSDYFG